MLTKCSLFYNNIKVSHIESPEDLIASYISFSDFQRVQLCKTRVKTSRKHNNSWFQFAQFWGKIVEKWSLSFETSHIYIYFSQKRKSGVHFNYLNYANCHVLTIFCFESQPQPQKMYVHGNEKNNQTGKQDKYSSRVINWVDSMTPSLLLLPQKHSLWINFFIWMTKLLEVRDWLRVAKFTIIFLYFRLARPRG